jgi:hypothetical protein
MIHGPCSVMNLNAPCTKNGKCTKQLPKQFHKHTINNYRNITLITDKVKRLPLYLHHCGTASNGKPHYWPLTWCAIQFTISKYVQFGLNVVSCLSVEVIRYVHGHVCAQTHRNRSNKSSEPDCHIKSDAKKKFLTKLLVLLM